MNSVTSVRKTIGNRKMDFIFRLRQKLHGKLTTVVKQVVDHAPALRPHLTRFLPSVASEEPAPTATSLVETGQTGLWDDSVSPYIKEGFKLYWETLDAVGKYQTQCITGQEDKEFCEFVIDTTRKQIGHQGLRGLCIGCSEMGRPEVTFLKSDLFQSFDILDIAEGLLQRQQEKADSEGLSAHYICQDLNTVRLDPERYDLIFALGSVHHIAKLEHFFQEIDRALSMQGIFAMREYVGENRLQYTPEQLHLTRAILSLIPPEYRLTPQGTIKQEEHCLSVEDWVRLDPSEAVRSADIIQLMKQELDVFYYKETGGGLLGPLLHDIAGHFERDHRGQALLASLIRLDREFFESGLLKSDYMFAFARKKNDPDAAS